MDIVRNPDGTLVVVVQPERRHDADDTAGGDGPDDGAAAVAAASAAQTASAPTTRLLHPGEGGYDEALAEWDLQQNPDREPVVSTASGREEAMTLVHTIATSSDHEATPALDALDDPDQAAKPCATFSWAAFTPSRTSPLRLRKQKAVIRFHLTR